MEYTTGIERTSQCKNTSPSFHVDKQDSASWVQVHVEEWHITCIANPVYGTKLFPYQRVMQEITAKQRKCVVLVTNQNTIAGSKQLCS